MISLKCLGNVHLTDNILKNMSQNRILSVFDFLQEDPEKLSTITKLNFPEVISIRTDIFNTFSARLINAINLIPEISIKKNILRTGIESLDAALRGGLPVGYLSEVCGLADSGKTQLCLQIAINCANDGSTILYVDTKRDFSVTRVQKSLEISGYSCQDMAIIMSKIKVVKIWTMDELNDFLKKIKNKIVEFNNLSLIIVDSLPSLMFQHLGDKSKIGLKLLNTFVNYSRYLSKEFNLGFVCVNVQTRWIEHDATEFEDDEDSHSAIDREPMLVEKRTRCLGKYWQNIPTLIIILDKCTENITEECDVLISCEILKTYDPMFKQKCHLLMTNSVIK